MNKVSILTILSLFISNFSHLVSASSRSRINGRRGALAKELAKLTKNGELKTKPGKIKCSAGTYLNSSSKTCISCNNGTWCPDAATAPLPCNNKPENSSYDVTVANKTSNCAWNCNTGYKRNGDKCVKITGNSDYTEEQKKETQKRLTTLSKALGDVQKNCTKIDANINDIMGWLGTTIGLNVVSTASSGAGLVTNLVKSSKEKMKITNRVTENSKEYSEEELFEKAKNMINKEVPDNNCKDKDNFNDWKNCWGSDYNYNKGTMTISTNSKTFVNSGTYFYEDKGISEKVEAKGLGIATTALLGTATATGAGSLVTGIVSAKKLEQVKNEVSNCQKSINNLKIADKAITEEDEKISQTIETEDNKYRSNADLLNKSENIIKGCDALTSNKTERDLEKSYNFIISGNISNGIGSVATLTGAITSGIATNKKCGEAGKEYNCKDGLNTTTNIMAAIGTGAGAVSTTTNSIAIDNIKKIKDQATTCQNSL